MIPWLKQHGWLPFALLVLFLQLGQRGLNEPDEGRYAEIAREMESGGDWLVPHLNDLPHFQKPPVLYWLTATSFHFFGENEWAARLPSALAALGVVLVVFVMARRLFADRDRAVIAAIVITTCGGFYAMSRLLTPDMTMTFWITAAIAAALCHRHWLFFILMGIGFLTKGPMALVVPLCAVIGWQRSTPADQRLHLPWARGLLLTMGISLSWFIILSLRDPRLAEYFWKYELLERFGSTTHGRSRPIWFFIMVLPIALLPWIFLLPVRRAWQRLRTRQFSPWHGLVLCWIVIPFAILSLSGSKLPTYILPLMPAFALAIAAALPSIGRAWKIALPTFAVFIIGDTWVKDHNDLLEVQASTKPLIEVLHAIEPDAAQAILFACETRTQGFAFYAHRPLTITRKESDLVGEPTDDQLTHLYSNAAQCARRLTGGKPAHGIVKTARYSQVFDPAQWRELARAGSFSLIANHPAHAE